VIDVGDVRPGGPIAVSALADKLGLVVHPLEGAIRESDQDPPVHLYVRIHPILRADRRRSNHEPKIRLISVRIRER